jgi:hypothetical protein
MKCAPSGSISKKKKVCVYCGKAFRIEGNISKKIINEKKILNQTE